jgi:hypothetical protein
MMKLPAIWQPTDSTRKLAAAQTALAAADERLAALQDERTAALRDDDIAGARRLDRQIADQREARTTFADRVALLQTKLAREQHEQRIAAHLAAVARIETDLLPPRAAAATALEAALKAVAVAARNFKEANDAVKKNWPAIVPRPTEYYLSTDRVGERAKECFQPGLLVRLYTSQAAASYEFTGRLLQADRHADGFAAEEAKHHAALLSDARAFRVPEIEQPDDDERAA